MYARCSHSLRALAWIKFTQVKGMSGLPKTRSLFEGLEDAIRLNIVGMSGNIVVDAIIFSVSLDSVVWRSSWQLKHEEGCRNSNSLGLRF